MYRQIFVRVIISGIIFFVFSCETLSHDIADHPSWKYLPVEDCGFVSTSDKIFGGETASLSQFPWMARIIYLRWNTTFYRCAGSIINKWYILTASHCMDEYLHSVRVGDTTEWKTNCKDKACSSPVQDIIVDKVVQYDNNEKEKTGDIALIKLPTAIKYNDYVQPICLPRGKIIEKMEELTAPGHSLIEVAGWGKTESKRFTEELMVVSMPIVDREVCRDNFIDNIDKSHLCVGAGDGSDSCTGDSGGPAMSQVALDGSPRYVLFGLVSSGQEKCGTGPGIYTNIIYFLKWILNHIEK